MAVTPRTLQQWADDLAYTLWSLSSSSQSIAAQLVQDVVPTNASPSPPVTADDLQQAFVYLNALETLKVRLTQLQYGLEMITHFEQTHGLGRRGRSKKRPAGSDDIINVLFMQNHTQAAHDQAQHLYTTLTQSATLPNTIRPDVSRIPPQTLTNMASLIDTHSLTMVDLI